jgi:peptidyl serine alpha-galactosyltransferase
LLREQQYPHLLAEMFAYSIAAAHLELKHQLLDSLMISSVEVGGEGWPFIDQIPAHKVCEFAKSPDHDKYAVPSVVHLCQRYFIGKDWFFGKRRIPGDIYDCGVRLFKEPPHDLATKYDFQWAPSGKKQPISPKVAVRESFMVCYLFSIVNEAATFYKKNACPADHMNLDKTRDMIEVFHSQKKKPKHPAASDSRDEQQATNR